MVNNKETVEELAISFYTFISDEQVSKKLKKGVMKKKEFWGKKFWIHDPFLHSNNNHVSPYNLYNFYHTKQDISSLLQGFFCPPNNLNFYLTVAIFSKTAAMFSIFSLFSF